MLAFTPALSTYHNPPALSTYHNPQMSKCLQVQFKNTCCTMLSLLIFKAPIQWIQYRPQKHTRAWRGICGHLLLFLAQGGAISYSESSLTCSASMQIYWNERKRLHEKRVQLPQDWFGTQTLPPFHCFGTPIWPPWRHVKTLYQFFGFLRSRVDVPSVFFGVTPLTKKPEGSGYEIEDRANESLL